jgi:ketosteroid isomerase-like protein
VSQHNRCLSPLLQWHELLFKKRIQTRYKSVAIAILRRFEKAHLAFRYLSSMSKSEPKSIALRFNERINARDLTGLGELMTEDHTFIDIPGEVTVGRDKMILGWFNFFKNYPDYRNNLTHLEVKGTKVIMFGFSECSYGPLDGPAIWTAEVRDGLVAEWRVYKDNPEIRASLGIE